MFLATSISSTDHFEVYVRLFKGVKKLFYNQDLYDFIEEHKHIQTVCVTSFY